VSESCPQDEPSLRHAAHPNTTTAYQFRIRDLLLVMFVVAVGLSGGTWFHPAVFALMLGASSLIAPVLLTRCRLHPRNVELIWGSLLFAYLIAAVVAVARQ